jgi:hypothetical protein
LSGDGVSSPSLAIADAPPTTAPWRNPSALALVATPGYSAAPIGARNFAPESSYDFIVLLFGSEA